MALLEINNLSGGYGDIKILENVSFSVEEGTIGVLLGPNGAGKSTLLKSLFSLTNVTSGEIIFNGENIINLPAHALLKKGISFVSQGKINFGLLSVHDNLQMGAHHIKDKKVVKKRLQKIYYQFPDLKKYKEKRAYTLSGGQQQMLAISRALMSNPKLLLMDEPSLGLSPKIVKDIFTHIETIKNDFNTTILIVEHNIKSLFDIADNGYILVNGKLVASGSCNKLKNSEILKKVFVGSFD